MFFFRIRVHSANPNLANSKQKSRSKNRAIKSDWSEVGVGCHVVNSGCYCLLLHVSRAEEQEVIWSVGERGLSAGECLGGEDNRMEIEEWDCFEGAGQVILNPEPRNLL
ncbi:hypothetical protein L596_028681 [Steinernema carpocapsae]|uniref:Uncharacterized protein n=1 Tax=Steinernema carpocapsae TaxID=34508 RepID=A0A4U5LZ34_STECR|nr:hypothetical protein L596_028681 [Steinernema carpocapsae]